MWPSRSALSLDERIRPASASAAPANRASAGEMKFPDTPDRERCAPYRADVIRIAARIAVLRLTKSANIIPGGFMPIAVGQPAPDFTLKDQNQKDVKLSDLVGKRNIVLMFYP